MSKHILFMQLLAFRIAPLVFLLSCGATEHPTLGIGPYSLPEVQSAIQVATAEINTALPGFANDVWQTSWTLGWGSVKDKCIVGAEGCLVLGTDGSANIYADPIYSPDCVADTALPHELIHLAQYLESGIRDHLHTTPGFWGKTVANSLEAKTYQAAYASTGCP